MRERERERERATSSQNIQVESVNIQQLLAPNTHVCVYKVCTCFMSESNHNDYWDNK